MADSKIIVSTTSELYAALKSATGGEQILLRPGNYGEVKLNTDVYSDFDFPSNVTIKSLNSDKPAVITALHVNDSSNITLDGITFDYTFKAGDPVWINKFLVNRSSDINIINSVFDGDLATGVSAIDDGFGYGVGLYIRDSDNVNVQNNEFSNFYRGALFSGTDGLDVSENEMFAIRSDGLNFAAVTDVLVENNYLHDFKRAPGSPDHMDMIQVWTTSTNTPTVGMTIRGNVLDIGEGSDTQAIFMRNGNVDSGLAGREMFYRDIVIEENTIYNAHLHGITVGETLGLTIRNNSLIRADGYAELGTDILHTPLINVSKNAENVRVTGNIAGGDKIEGHAGQSTWTVDNNLFIQDSDSRDPGFYNDVFVMSSMTRTDSGHAFVLRPDLSVSGVGSELLQFDGTPNTLLPLFDVTSRNNQQDVLVFDASMTSDRNGPVDAEDADFVWTFGDGTMSYGPVVQHKFDGAGHYEVSLTVNGTNGSTATTHYRVGVAGETLVAFDSGTGAFVNPQFGQQQHADFTIDKVNRAPGEATIVMDGSGVQATISQTDLTNLFGADNYHIKFAFKSTAGANSSGEVFRVHGNFVATVDANGNLAFTAFGTDGSSPRAITSGVSFLDGKTHHVGIRYDGKADTVKVWVDGELSASIKMTGDLPYYPRELTFGNPWGTKTFVGEISTFEVNAEQTQYDKFTGNAQLINKVSVASADVLSINDFVLDIANFDDQPNSRLHDDASVITQQGEAMLQFDGRSDMATIGKLEAISGQDELTMSLDFTRSFADGSDARLVSNNGKLSLFLDDDGLVLRVRTEDEGQKTFAIDDLGLNDTERHRAIIIIDDQTDRMQVLMDGVVLLDERDTDFDLTSVHNKWRFSTGWEKQTFDGEISDFRLEAAADFIDSPETFTDSSFLI